MKIQVRDFPDLLCSCCTDGNVPMACVSFVEESV
jgi:hypothetical protein